MADFKDYLNIANPLAMQVSDPTLRFKHTMNDPDFSWDNHKDIWDSYSLEQKRAAAGALSLEHANILVDRSNTYQDSLEQIDKDPAWKKYPTLLGASLTDPVNFIPIGGTAIKISKAASTLGRMLEVGAKVGVVGAASNVASESLYDTQGLPTDYTGAALIGFAAGFGIGGIAEGIGRTWFKSRAANALRSDELERNLEIDNTTIVHDVPQGEVARITKTPMDEVGQQSKGNWVTNPSFLESDASILWSSHIPEAREYISRLTPASTAVKGADGKAIPQMVTANDMKHKWKGDINQARLDLMTMHRDAIVDGRYKGSMDQYNEDIARELRRLSHQQETQIYKEVYGLKDKERDAKIKDLYDKWETKFGDDVVGQGAKRQYEYYNKMLKRGQDLGIKELSGISPNKIYMPRVWDFTKISTTGREDLKAVLTEAVVRHPGNEKHMVPGEFELMIEDLTDKFLGLSKDRLFMDFSYVVPEELPLSTHLKSQKIKLDDSVMSDFLLKNSDDIMGLYHYKQSGQMGIQYAFNTTDLKQIQDEWIQPIRNKLSHGDEKTAQALDRVLHDTLGILRMPQNGDSLGWKTSRLLSQWNALTYGGSFGLNTLTEIPAAMMATGYKKGFISHFSSTLKGVHDVLFRGRASSDDLTNEFIAMGNMQEVFQMQGINRLADTEGVVNSGWLEHKAMGLTDSLFKWNGMRGITASLESLIGGNAVMDLLRMSNKGTLSSKELDRLTRWGLDEGMLEGVAKTIKKHAEFDGDKLKKLNFEKWDEASSDIIQTAIGRAIKSGVIQGDTVHLPSWMIVPDPVRRLVTQFMRFPIAAHEILLRRGWEEDKAGLIASGLGAMFIYGNITYLREQAAIASGLKEDYDARYDIFNDPDGEMTMNLIMKSMNYMASTGALTLPLGYANTLAGKDFLGKDSFNSPASVLGPSISRLEQVRDIIYPIVSEGRVDDTRQWYALQYMATPNLPLLSEGLKAVIKEETY
jgi:hypothetical protein